MTKVEQRRKQYELLLANTQIDLRSVPAWLARMDRAALATSLSRISEHVRDLARADAEVVRLGELLLHDRIHKAWNETREWLAMAESAAAGRPDRATYERMRMQFGAKCAYVHWYWDVRNSYIEDPDALSDHDHEIWERIVEPETAMHHLHLSLYDVNGCREDIRELLPKANRELLMLGAHEAHDPHLLSLQCRTIQDWAYITRVAQSVKDGDSISHIAYAYACAEFDPDCPTIRDWEKQC